MNKLAYNRYYAYAYVTILTVLRYVLPFILFTVGTISIILEKWEIFTGVLALMAINLLAFMIATRKETILSKEVSSKNILSNKKSDFLLAISLDEIEKSSKKHKFSEQDWSCSWINTLMQETGTYRVMDIDNLRKKDIFSARAVILSRSASRRVSEAQKDNFKEFAVKGGVLILEQPPNKLNEISGAVVSDKMIIPKSLTFVDNDYRDYFNLKKIPLNTNMFKLSGREESAKVLMSFDNFPAILKYKLGKGLSVTLTFDFGMQITSMQQGRPAEDYSVEDKTSFKDLIESQDLILSKVMEHNDFPFADMLEKFVFRIAMEFQPIPALWCSKGKYAGTFIMTHDEDYYGDKIKYMIDHEKSIKATSTFFITPSPRITKKAAKEFFEVSNFALHWDKMKSSLFFMLGFPCSNEDELNRQINLLESNYGRKITSNRNHFLKWDTHYTNVFRALCKNGIKLDSTYGPNYGRGYLFGTNFAFFPMETNGMPMPILELPFQVQELFGGVTLSYVKSLFRANCENYHGALVFSFHPQHSHEGSRARPIWKESYRLAKQSGHWITNLGEFYDFWKKRHDAVMHSSLSNNKLNISIQSAGQTIMVQEKYMAKKIKAIKIDRMDIRADKSVSVMGLRFSLIIVPSGMHRIEVSYH